MKKSHLQKAGQSQLKKVKLNALLDKSLSIKNNAYNRLVEEGFSCSDV